MSISRAGIAIVLLTWLGLCIQLSFGQKISLMGVSPDFLLVVLLAFAPTMSRTKSALHGFVIGAVYGACVGASLWQYVAMFSITGFLIAWLVDNRITTTLPVLFGTGLFGTVLARLILMFLIAPSGIGSYLGDTILSAVYNGVLVLSLYALLKRFVDPAFR